MKRLLSLMLIVAFLVIPATAQTLDTSSVTVGAFVLENYVHSDQASCRPMTRSDNPKLRLRASNTTTASVTFENAELLEAENDVYPGEAGCFVSGTFTIDPTMSYSILIQQKSYLSVEGAELIEAGGLLIVVDKDGLVNADLHGDPVPTPVPTEAPTPTPTPEPTPTPIPAGDQGDGTFLLRGYLTLYDDEARYQGDYCTGTGGYSDIASGTQVVIRDGENSIIGVGRLDSSGVEQDSWGCNFMFEVEVPETEFYQLEVSSRGQLVYTFEEFEYLDWTIETTLG